MFRTAPRIAQIAQKGAIEAKLRRKDQQDEESVEIALYGNTKIFRAKCYVCDETSFVLDGYTVCCGAPIARPKTHSIKRESQPQFRRKRLSSKYKDEIVENQNNKCFYCNRLFGSWVEKVGRGKYRLEKLSITFDHWEPYCYSADSTSCNFVASCQICNSYKSDISFNSEDQARQFLLEKWDKYGWKDAV